MGVNMAGNCIIDQDIVKKAANAEIIRRYFATVRLRREGSIDDEMVFKSDRLLKRAGIVPEDRNVVRVVREYMKDNKRVICAAELPDGTIVTGKSSPLLGASSAMILNALKRLAGLDDSVLLISPEVIRSMQRLKVDYLGYRNTRLYVNEMLVALSIAANDDPNAERAFSKLPELRGCDVHLSVIPTNVNEMSFKKLGMHLSCEPVYQTQSLFQGN